MLASRLVSLVGTLVLARLLTPDDFGLLAIGVVSIEVIVSLSDIGMRSALIQRQDLEPAHYDTAWTMEITRGAVVAIIAFIGAPLISQLFDDPRAENIIRALAFVPLLASASSIKVVDLTRALRFRPLALTSVSSAIVHFTIAIILAPGFGVWGLVAGVLAGALTGAILSYLVAPYAPRLSFDGRVARSLFLFGRWIFLTGVIAVAGDAVLRGAIGRELGTMELGLYYLAARLAFLPNEMVSEAISEVAFPLHAQLKSEAERARRTFQASLVSSWAVLIPAYALLIALAPPLVEEILGPRWSGTASIIRILALIGVIGVVADATMPLLKGRGRPQDVAALYAIRTLITIALIWVLIPRWDLIGAALALLVAEIGAQVWCVAMSRRLLNQPFFGVWRRVWAIVGASAIGTLIAVACDAVFGGPIGVIAAALLGFGSAAIVLIVLDRWLKLGLTNDLAQAMPGLSQLLRQGGAKRSSEQKGVESSAASGPAEPDDDPPRRL